jgi:hypothetical protein
MRAQDELMDRLANADPLPDAERLTPDERREADALLARALATPVRPARRAAARHGVRRGALVAVGIACVALAAFAAVDLVDSDAPGPSVVERALAAVSDDGTVYHVLERKRLRAPGESVPRENRRIYVESWHTTGGRLHQRLFWAAPDGERGRLFGDFAGSRTEGRRGGPALTWNARDNTIQSIRFGTTRGARGAPSLNPYADPGEALRTFEAQDRLRVAGTADVDGTRAYRLVSGYVQSSPKLREKVEFLVDAETYLPLASHSTQLATSGDRYDLFTRYLVYERLRLDASGRAKLDLDRHPGASCAPGAGAITGRGSLGFPNPCR